MKQQNPLVGRRLVLALLFVVIAALFLTAATTQAAPEQTCGRYHHVRHGETLSTIAWHYGVSVADLMRANPKLKDPNRIYAGAKLYIPCRETGVGGRCSQVHYVEYGQTLSEIAWKYRVNPFAVARANNIQNPNLIFAGTRLCIP